MRRLAVLAEVHGSTSVPPPSFSTPRNTPEPCEKKRERESRTAKTWCKTPTNVYFAVGFVLRYC